MAKRRINRSQAIRDFLAENPKATPKEIIAALANKRIKVSATLVSQVKYSKPAAKKRHKKVRRKKAGRPAAAARSNGLNIDALVAAKKLADQVGGVDQAKEALDALGKLI